MEKFENWSFVWKKGGKKNSKEIRAINDNLKKDFKVGGESKKLKYCKKKSSPLSFDSNLREKNNLEFWSV